MTDEPRVIAETSSYIVVFKPHGMHSAPLREDEAGTLLAWCSEICPDVLSVRGRKDIERGLMHRLDRETAGLVLFAKTQGAYDFLRAAQEQGSFLKEYEAICADPGNESTGRITPFSIESAFRPYGPGRRVVRAVDLGHVPKHAELALDHGRPYLTEVLSIQAQNPPIVRVIARLARGFRHQIRCHLAWIGLPIVGDDLYGTSAETPLGLTAISLTFPDPISKSEIRIDADQFFDGFSSESRMQ